MACACFLAGRGCNLSTVATAGTLSARGTLRAAQWLVKQKRGLYSMQDVLGLD